MKKGMIAVLITALILVQAAAVLAEATSYIDPNSLLADKGGVVRDSTVIVPETTNYNVVNTPIKVNNGLIAKKTMSPCNVKVTADPQDRYFLGTARKDCVTNNKGNMYCQNKCYEQVKLIILRGSNPTMATSSRTFARFGCNIIDSSALASTKTASQCYFTAKDACAVVNPGSSYCRTKCTQSGYALCRHDIASMKYV